MKIINNNNQLEKICEKFKDGKYVTVDTEFMREKTFRPILCLIQIANEKNECIIDPMEKELNLKPFFELMQNEKIVKVFHAARQDLEIFYCLNNKLPKPIFDTQIAAMVCGYGDQVSYSNLVEKIAKQEIDKTSRFTDWSLRPLSDSQLRYALADVTHLREVYEKLKKQLEENKRIKWVEQEMNLLNDPQTYNPPAEKAWMRIKTKLKKSNDLAVLQSLAKWRETQARELNVPRGRIIKDDVLQEIALQKPKNINELKKLRALPQRFIKNENAKGIINAVEQGIHMPNDEKPVIKPKNKMPKGGAAGLEMIKMLVKVIAEEKQVAARLIATTEEMEKFITEPEEKNNIMQGWRYEIFGQYAQKMINGEMFIGIKDGKIIIREE